MPRTAPPFARRQFRRVSMMLASTAMLVGYSQMTLAAETAAPAPAATAPADGNPMLAPWTGPDDTPAAPRAERERDRTP